MYIYDFWIWFTFRSGLHKIISFTNKWLINLVPMIIHLIVSWRLLHYKDQVRLPRKSYHCKDIITIFPMYNKNIMYIASLMIEWNIRQQYECFYLMSMLMLHCQFTMHMFYYKDGVKYTCNWEIIFNTF
jgi:hypothetical protein